LHDAAEVAKRREAAAMDRQKVTALQDSLEGLKHEYMSLIGSDKPQKRGYKLEKILTKLFEVFDLDPKASFKVVGEQIDGGFTFAETDYLLEAKWQKEPIAASDLDSLSAKVNRKLDNTLGLYISINGYSADGLIAFSKSKLNIFLVDGEDLFSVLDGRIKLPNLLLRKRKAAAHDGNIYLRFRDF